MRVSTFILAFAAGAGFAGTVRADVPDSDIVRCATMMDDGARLACYDAIAAARSPRATEAAAQRKQAAARSAEQAAKEKAERERGAFGAEDVAALRDQRDAEKQTTEVKALTATVTEAYRDARDRWLLFLDNGQIWRQTEDRLNSVKSGDVATIERGFLSGYKLHIKGKRRVVPVARVK